MNEVCADFVRLLLGRMAQRVPTMITLQKITRDHGEEKFGEFRSIIGMLDNTRYEQSILTTAKELLANTKFEQVSKLHRGQTEPLAKLKSGTLRKVTQGRGPTRKWTPRQDLLQSCCVFGLLRKRSTSLGAARSNSFKRQDHFKMMAKKMPLGT